MNYINAIIFGIIQGLTEFLPVSSSGHLVLLHNFISLPIENELLFDIILHLATLIAVVYFFRQDIWRLLLAWLKWWRKGQGAEARIAWFIILATIPASLVGFFFQDIIESVLRSTLVVAVMLILVAILFILIERLGKQKKKMKNLNWRDALAIGLAQALALIPGTSRSGITIIAGMGVNLKREEAIRFSFLLSIPIILGAVIKQAPEIFGAQLQAQEGYLLGLAFFSALVSGFFAIKYFLVLARKYSLTIFAIYRFILAAVLLIYIFSAR